MRVIIDFEEGVKVNKHQAIAILETLEKALDKEGYQMEFTLAAEI